MSPEHFDDPLEVEVLSLLELVPAGADPTGCRRGSEESDLFFGCGREVEQFFLEDAFDAEMSGVDGAKGPGMPPAGLDDAAERVVDDAGRPSRLGDDDVASGHGSIDPFKVEVGGVQARIGLAHRSDGRSGRHHPMRRLPGRFVLDCSTRRRIKASPERPASCTPGRDPLTAPGASNKMGPANGSNGVSGIGHQQAFSVRPTRSPGDNHPMATLSGQPLPQSPACSPMAAFCSCLGLFAVGLAINMALVQCANAQFWLTGEEASVAFKDVVFLRLRLQHDRYDTNLGGHILYFLAHAVHPDPGLWYGRETKAVLMALAGPLTYLFGRRLGLGCVASAFAGICIFLFPGFSSFAWIGMEAGLELLFGGLALYLACGRSIWTWPLAAALLGFGILVYGGGAAFVVPVLGLIGWRLWRDHDRRSLLSALASAGVFAGVLALPSLWWVNTSHAYRGGGTIELARAPVLFLRLLYESFYKPHSYYFFSTSPGLGGVLLLPLLAAGVYASSRKPFAWWPLWMLALGSIGLYSIATPTGVRRAIPLVFVASLLLGEVLDWALQLPGRSRPRVVTVCAHGCLAAGRTDAGHRARLEQPAARAAARFRLDRC